MKAGSCRYNIRIGYRHTSSRHPLLLHKTVNTDLYRLLKPLDELIVPILGQAYVRYPSVALGTCPQSIITDQITDQYAPYCSELSYAVSNDYIELDDCWWMKQEMNTLFLRHKLPY